MLQELPQNIIFQQDRASLHQTRVVRDLFEVGVPSSSIDSVVQQIDQPALQISCHMTFYRMNMLKTKSKVQGAHCPSSTRLKMRITSSIWSTSKEVPENVWESLNERVNAIIRETGGHINAL